MSIDVHPETLARAMSALIDDLTTWDAPAIEHTLKEWHEALGKLTQPVRIYDLLNLTEMVHQQARLDRGYEDA